jgi:hypothetical protein
VREGCSSKKFQTPETDRVQPGSILALSGSPSFVAEVPSTDLWQSRNVTRKSNPY